MEIISTLVSYISKEQHKFPDMSHQKTYSERKESLSCNWWPQSSCYL